MSPGTVSRASAPRPAAQCSPASTPASGPSSGKVPIRQHRPVEGGEAGWIAIGADGDVGQPDGLDHRLQHAAAANVQQRLVAAAHPARGTAGQDDGNETGAHVRPEA